MATVQVEKNDAIATITLNRPEKLNALVLETVPELNEILDELETDSSIRVIILTGKGSVFCAGADLNSLLGDATYDMVSRRNMIRSFMRLAIRMRYYDKPFIAAVNGPAVGGGAALALVCDLIIASREARFDMGFVKVGLSASDIGMTYFLPKNVGYAKAAELLFLGEKVEAAEAKEMGMINAVVSHSDLMNKARQYAETIAEGPPIGISLTKFALNRELGMDLATALESEPYIMNFAMETEDHQEGVQAFLEKREPRFKGK